MKRASISAAWASCAVFAAIFAALALPEHALAARAQEAPTTTESALESATVNLYCQLKSGRKTYSASGSGVFISERGVILTNAHVAQYFFLEDGKGSARGDCQVRTGSPARKAYKAEVLYFPPNWLNDYAEEFYNAEPRGSGKNDFALLYVTDAVEGSQPDRFPALRADIGMKQGAFPVTVAGYPILKPSFKKIRDKLARTVTQTSVAFSRGFNRAMPQPDVLTLSASDAASGGISGGPVVDGAGNVIAIATSRGGDDGKSLNSITLSYIDRAVREQTGLPLDFLTTGDLSVRALITSFTVPPNAANTVAGILTAKKR